MANSKASVALLERISELAGSKFGNEGHTVALPAHGSPLAAEHLDLLNDPDAAQIASNEQVKALLEISKLVDCIQDGGRLFRGPEQDPGFLSDRFRAILQNVAFAPARVEPEVRERYQHALSALYVDPPFEKTDAYAQFSASRTDLEQKELALRELQRRAAAATGEVERSLLTEEIATLQSLIDEERDVVEALDRQHAFSAAEQTKDLVEASVTDVPDSVSDALGAFDLFQITDPASNESHVLCSFMPSQLSEDNWVPVKLTRDEIQAAPGDSALLSGASSSVAFLDDAAVETLELEVQMLAVQRPWFWGGLFENRFWRWKTTPSEPVSSGVEGGGGLIPAYVAGLIVARNLVVRGSATTASSSTPANDIHPIRIGNIETSRGRRPESTPVAAPGSFQTTSARVLRPASVAGVSSRLVTFRNRQGRRPEGREVRRIVGVRGKVSDEQGLPIIGATVILRDERTGARHSATADDTRERVRDHRGQRTLTARGGAFAFNVVAGASYVLTVAKAGFVSSTRTFRLVNAMDIPVRLRSEQSTWPLLTVRLISPDGAEPFEGRSELRISGPGSSTRTERLVGQAAVGIRLPSGRYRVEVVSPDARQVLPAVRIVDLSTSSSLEFTVESGVLLRNPDLHLIGFICRCVPLSPDPDKTVFPSGNGDESDASIQLADHGPGATST